MFQGKLIAIHHGARRGEPLQTLAEIEALAGRGLAGDRYCDRKDPEQQITLFESEALAALAADYGITLAPVQTRRNLLTEGVPLNHLVGREFEVGAVRLRGIKLCEPCNHLQKLTVPGVLKGLLHRGGLRAQIVRGGILRTGDPITPAT